MHPQHHNDEWKNVLGPPNSNCHYTSPVTDTRSHRLWPSDQTNVMWISQTLAWQKRRGWGRGNLRFLGLGLPWLVAVSFLLGLIVCSFRFRCRIFLQEPEYDQNTWEVFGLIHWKETDCKVAGKSTAPRISLIHHLQENIRLATHKHSHESFFLIFGLKVVFTLKNQLTQFLPRHTEDNNMCVFLNCACAKHWCWTTRFYIEVPTWHFHVYTCKFWGRKSS